MRVRFCLLTLVAIALTTAAPAAAVAAPAIALNRTCYLSGGVVGVSGSGFAPNIAVNVTQNGTPVGSAQTDALGSFTRSYNAPTVSETARLIDIDVSASDGTSTAAAASQVSAFNADFSPAQGNPRTLKVRMIADGFNLLSATPSTIYLHYIAPNGKRKLTKRLGVAQGPCGTFTAKKRKLFPFSPKRGLWKLQWDTKPKYTKCTRDSAFLCFVREVRIFLS
jgi:hypothetical protein